MVLGFALLAYPSGWPTDTNRLTDLGAALAGGAVIALAVLLVERGFQAEAERRALQFQLGLQETVASVDLRELDLRGSYWMRKMVSESNLSGVEFDGSSLYECRIVRTYLFGARFAGANLTGTKFDGAWLAGASFRDANLAQVDFRLAVFGRRDRDNVSPVTKGKFGSVDFAGADLDKTDLRGADLRNVEGLASAVNKHTARHDQATRWPRGNRPSGFGAPEGSR